MKATVETRKAQVLTWSGKREFSDKTHRWVPVAVGSCENQVLKPSKNKGHCSQPTASNTESLNKENDANWQNRARGLCWEHRYPWQEPGGLRGISQPRCQLLDPTCSAPLGKWHRPWGSSHSPDPSLIWLSLWYLLHTVCDLFLLLFINAQLANAKVGVCTHAKLLQSRVSLCDPVDRSPQGSSVRGILQARTVEWVAMPSCRGSSWPRDWTPDSRVSCTAGSVLPVPPGKHHKGGWLILEGGYDKHTAEVQLKKINSKNAK